MPEEINASERRLWLLNSIATKLIAEPEPRQQLEDAFRAVAQELGARYFFFYQISEKHQDRLELMASAGLDKVQQEAIRYIQIGEHLCGHVASTRTMQIVEAIQQLADPRATHARSLGIEAYAGLPLMAHGSLLGTICFASTERQRFSLEEIAFLGMLVGQFAASLDRERLLDRLRESEARYRGAVITGRIAAWETNMVTRMRIWTEEGMEVFGLKLANGFGQVGGENDEFWRSLHPDDKHMMAQFHRTADQVDTYPCEYRIVRPDGTMLWVSGRGRVVARGPDGKAQRVANIVVDVTARKSAEEQAQLLMREMSHRSKNLLAVVQGIAKQTVRSSRDLKEYEEKFVQRLQALAASHDLLVQENWQGAPIADLVRQQLAPFAEIGPKLTAIGPKVVLTAEASQTVGLALHELATNATKHGAWMAATGRVSVEWGIIEQPGKGKRLRLSWVENGGPLVVPPTRRGFGHVVIENMAAQTVQGEAQTNFDSAGFRWTLLIPMDHLIEMSDGHASSMRQTA